MKGNVIKKILYPPAWLLMLLIVLSAALLSCIFILRYDTHPLSSVAYALSFYTLSITVLRCIRVFPIWFRKGKGTVYRYKYSKLYLTDTVFKTRVTLYGSLAVNLIYVLINAISAPIYGSAWFVIFALYYGVLAVMRFLLASYISRHGIGEDILGELRRARVCAVILLNMNFLLTGAVLMMVYSGRGFEYRGFLIYVMALYAFWMTASAIRDIARHRRHNSPIISCAKVVKLAAALFSMLSLETAMLAQFGSDMAKSSQNVLIMATGGGIAVILIALSTATIVITTNQIRIIKDKQSSDISHRKAD